MAEDVYLDKGGAVFNVKVSDYYIESDGSADDRDDIYALATDGGKMNGEGTMLFPPGIYQAGPGSIPSTTLAIPAGVTMTLVNGAILNMWEPGTPWDTCTLELTGTLAAGLYQVFGIERNTAPVRFKGASIPEVFPEWFGAKAGGTVDCAGAISAAISSLPSEGGVIRFVRGAYRVKSDLNVPPGTVLAFNTGARLQLWDDSVPPVPKTMTCSGDIDARPSTLFDLSIDPANSVIHPAPVAFADGTNPEVRPEWFGARTGGQTDCADALRAAVASMPSTGGQVRFKAGTYRVGHGTLGQAWVDVQEGTSLGFDGGAMLDMSDLLNGETLLNLAGDLRAGNQAVFDLTNNPTPVRFGDGTNPVVKPEWFGARAGNVFDANQVNVAEQIPDSTRAFRAAVAAMPRTGGEIRLGAGQYKITDEIVVDKNSVVFRGVGRQGALYSQSTVEFGSWLFFGADWAGNDPNAAKSLLRFAQVFGPVTGETSHAWGCGVRDLSICQYPAQRAYPCDAAIHVESGTAFSLDNCTFDWIPGAALKVSVATQCQFGNVKIKRCGANDAHGERPAVWLRDANYGSEPDGEIELLDGAVQGSVFTGFKVEVCYGTSYFYVGEGNPANKFDDMGFEGDLTNMDVGQTFLHVRGEANHFGKIHFNRCHRDTPTAKMVLDAVRCQFDSLAFNGLIGPGGGLRLEQGASHNVIQSVIVAAGHNLSIPSDPSMATHFPYATVAGTHNRIGVISSKTHTSSYPTTGTIAIEGEANSVGEMVDTARLLVRVRGRSNRIGSLNSDYGRGTVLTVDGSDCEVHSAVIRGARNPHGVIVDVTGDASGCRLGLRIIDAQAQAGVRVAGEDTFLLAGSRIQDVNSGVGLLWQGANGGWDGLDVSEIDETGIRIDGGSPRRMTRWTVRHCNRVNGPYGGFDASSTVVDAEGAVCTDFLIREDGSTHAFAFRIGEAGGGIPAYQNNTIRGNVVGGGIVVIPKGGPNAVDLDSQGMGDDVASNTLITLPVTANLVVVTGTNTVATITPSWRGRKVTLLCKTSNLTFLDASHGSGDNIKLGIGTSWQLSTDDSLTLVCDGTDWFMVGRTA